MTNGASVIVRGARKPLSDADQAAALSVDTQTPSPAQALASAPDSARFPAAAVVGEAMVSCLLSTPIGASSAGITSTTYWEAVGAYR